MVVASWNLLLAAAALASVAAPLSRGEGRIAKGSQPVAVAEEEAAVEEEELNNVNGEQVCRFDAAGKIDCRGREAPSGEDEGRIFQSLFRFPVSRLGSGFDALLQQWHGDWLRAPNATRYSGRLPPVAPEPSGKAHALLGVSTPAATLFRRQCYGAPRSPQMRDLYRTFERRRKEVAFRYLDAAEEMRLLHAVANRFFPAFLPPEEREKRAKAKGPASARRTHKETPGSTASGSQSTLPPGYDTPSRLSFQTVSSTDASRNNQTQEWSWFPPAHFSSRGTPHNLQFRKNLHRAMRGELQRSVQEAALPDFEFEHGRASGMYWYPPGGVREWHSNYLDLVGHTGASGDGSSNAGAEDIFASQVWRMYFVRTARDDAFDDDRFEGKETARGRRDDRSAMHIVPGEQPGITLDVLREAGARPLTEDESRRQWSDEFAEDYPIPAAAQTAEENSAGEDAAFDREAVWRLPDRDGYVTLFRLPDLWHCIVSEEVHRYSLGFAFSDREVQALLTLADVKFDMATGKEANDNAADDKHKL